MLLYDLQSVLCNSFVEPVMYRQIFCSDTMIAIDWGDCQPIVLQQMLGQYCAKCQEIEYGW